MSTASGTSTAPEEVQALARGKSKGHLIVAAWEMRTGGRSQRAIAEALGVHVDTIARWERQWKDATIAALGERETKPIDGSPLPLTAERIRAMRARAVALAMRSSDPQTVRLGLTACADQARMDGLDAPQQVEQTTVTQHLVSQGVEALTMGLRERMGRLAERGVLGPALREQARALDLLPTTPGAPPGGSATPLISTSTLHEKIGDDDAGGPTSQTPDQGEADAVYEESEGTS
jgi:transposase-like protein